MLMREMSFFLARIFHDALIFEPRQSLGAFSTILVLHDALLMNRIVVLEQMKTHRRAPIYTLIFVETLLEITTHLKGDKTLVNDCLSF